MRRILVALVLAFAMCFGVGGAGAQRTITTRYGCSHGLRPCWLPVLYWAVGECETGLSWRHSTSGYEGAFGFARSSWNAYRGRFPYDATRATPREQYVVIRRMGLGGNGCYVNGGYRYWMARA